MRSGAPAPRCSSRRRRVFKRIAAVVVERRAPEHRAVGSCCCAPPRPPRYGQPVEDQVSSATRKSPGLTKRTNSRLSAASSGVGASGWRRILPVLAASAPGISRRGRARRASPCRTCVAATKRYLSYSSISETVCRRGRRYRSGSCGRAVVPELAVARVVHRLAAGAWQLRQPSTRLVGLRGEGAESESDRLRGCRTAERRRCGPARRDEAERDEGANMR